VVGTPKVERDTDDDTITYSFRAEPAGFHEMIEDLKMSYFHGHYAEVPPRPCVALVRVEAGRVNKNSTERNKIIPHETLQLLTKLDTLMDTRPLRRRQTGSCITELSVVMASQ
jgi:hypothetical protein